MNGDADSSDVDSEIFNAGQDESAESVSLVKTLRTTRKRDAIKERLLRAKETTKDVFNRGRNKAETRNATVTSTAPPLAETKKEEPTDAEIESGVEMVEDMVVVPAVAESAGNADSVSTLSHAKNRRTLPAPQRQCDKNKYFLLVS